MKVFVNKQQTSDHPHLQLSIDDKGPIGHAHFGGFLDFFK